MTNRLRRQELFELIWAQPRTQLVKLFGVSDVFIGKQCRRARIPGPPPGYWARSEVAKGKLKPVLPVRLPGQSEYITIKSLSHHPRTNVEEEPLVEPVFAEIVELQVAAAMELVGKISKRREGAELPECSKSIREAEALRRSESGMYRFIQRGPYFDDRISQRLMRILESIGQAMEKAEVGATVLDLAEHDQTPYHHRLGLRLAFGEVTLLVESRCNSGSNSKGGKGLGLPQILVGSKDSPLGIQTWEDEHGKPLERQLNEISAALFQRAERAYRQQSMDAYQRAVEWRERRRLEALERRTQAELKRQAELIRRREQFRKDIAVVAADLRTAKEIRTLVEELRAHTGMSASQVGEFEQWTHAALDEADRMDPMLRPIDQLLKSLDLLDEKWGLGQEPI